MVSKSKKEVRVRIAPSPTGYFHIGTARTALFNYLFARQNEGVFILRIEDTDLERSEKKFEEDILEGLKWLGLEWDEGPTASAVNPKSQIPNPKYIGGYGPYRQTERLEIYECYLRQLLDKNFAYYCFCSKEDLEAERQAMMTQGLAPKYSGRCRTLKPEEIKEKLHSSAGHIIRLKMPELKITFKDLIRGPISFDTGLIGDITIAKDIRTPLYNFAVVIDDYEMEISHVIRGEDHLANTPKQIALQKALGFPHPHYGHLPLILDPDRSKMSNRYSVTSIKEHRAQGFLPDALINFIALLGWHPKDDREILSRDVLVKEFDIDRIQKAGAVFNEEKLEWVNQQYLKRYDNKTLASLLKIGGFVRGEPSERLLTGAIEPTKERIKKLSDFPELAGFFFELSDYPSELLIWKDVSREKTLENLKALLEIIPDVAAVMKLAEERGRGEVLWPLRAALSGKQASPGPLEIMEVLGKMETVKRIKSAISKLGKA